MAAAPDRMTAEDLARARTLLGLSPGELAAEIGLTEPVVRAWEEGSLRIPRQYAIQIVWRAAVAERQAALASSGLPECEWVARWMDVTPPAGTGQRGHIDALRRHATMCPQCTARARFIEQNFPPMPELPTPTFVRAMRSATKALERFPRWLRLAVVASLAAGAFSALQVAGLVASGEPPSLGKALLLIGGMMVFGAYIGATAGITFLIVRDPLRRLGRVGDALTGVLCAWVCLLAALAPAQFFTDQPAFATPENAAAVALVTGMIGGVVGHFWFRRRQTRHGP